MSFDSTGEGPGGQSVAASSFRSVLLEVIAQCPGCGQPMAVPGIVQRVVCGQCGTPTALSPTFWKRVLSDPLHEALGLPQGKGRSAQLRSEPPVRLLYGRMVPRCAGCASPLPAQTLAEAAVTSESGDGALFCPVCGTKNACRVVPRWFSEVHPAPGFLVNEPLPRQEPLPSACPSCEAPIVPTPGLPQRNCMRCGAPLRRAGHSAPAGGTRWYMLANLGQAVGVVPREAVAFCDLAVDPRGGMAVAWVAEAAVTRKRMSLVGVLDQRGLLRWVSDHGRFSERASLHFAERRNELAVADPVEGVLSYFDATSGELVGELRPPDVERDDLLDLRDHVGLAFAPDGTMLVASPRAGGDPQLARFGDDGRRVPLWEGLAPEEEVVAFRASEAAAPFDEVPDRPVRLAPDTAFTVGWDGRVYLADRATGAVARYAPDGTCEGVARPEGDVVDRVLDVGADAQGTVYLLFRHRRPFGDDPAEHVARITPDRGFEVWVGAYAESSPIVLGPAPERLKVRADGAVLLGGDMPQLIVVGRDRAVLWHHPGRLRHQRRALEAPNRRGRHGRGRVRRISSVNTSL